MSRKNDPRIGHAPGDIDEALSWLNRMAHGEPEMHLVSLRQAMDLVRRELFATRINRDEWRRHAEERLAEVERENVALREACEAVLMFYQAVDWGEKSRNRWAALTGSKDATTRVMCDTVRRALGQKESERG